MRPLSHVPRPVLLLLVAALALQLALPGREPANAGLPPPPDAAILRLASLGEPVALAKSVMLTVQNDDRDPRLADWLERVLDLDPRGQYPLLAASQVYAVGEAVRVRAMLDLVYRRFGEDPDRRWPWLAHAAIVARHRLHDMPLARRYARAIRERTAPAVLPAWAAQMEVFILEDMGEAQAARTLIGAMLASGQVRDARELAFLEQRLRTLDEHPAKP